MIILSIESSCDETGVAVFSIEEGLMAHIVHSQVKIHENYGGVVPELASRDHVKRIIPLIENSLKKSSLKLSDIDAISYTAGPGLMGSLLIGASFAQSLSWIQKIPIIPVHHLEGHLLSVLLDKPCPNFPYLSLLVSGGHTQLTIVHDIGKYTLLGETLDDAAGEALDKIAKLLGLGYPGGALLEFLAKSGGPSQIKIPKPLLKSKNLNFSFSGLKTAVFKKIQLLNIQEDKKAIANLAYAAQNAIIEILVSKSLRALKETEIQDLSIVGGVASNEFLRNEFKSVLRNTRNRLFIPPIELCTDNGAMIAFVAAQRISRGFCSSFLENKKNKQELLVKPRWDILNQ